MRGAFWLNIRHKDHNKPSLHITEEGHIELRPLEFVGTGVDGDGCPEAFEPPPILDAEDLRWITRLADEFSDKEEDCLLQDVLDDT